KPPRVQRVPLELKGPQRRVAVDVAPLADERVAPQPRLEANLVAPAALQLHLHERRVLEDLQDAIAADGLLRPRIAGMGLFLNERLVVPHEMVAPFPLARIGM